MLRWSQGERVNEALELQKAQEEEERLGWTSRGQRTNSLGGGLTRTVHSWACVRVDGWARSSARGSSRGESVCERVCSGDWLAGAEARLLRRHSVRFGAGSAAEGGRGVIGRPGRERSTEIWGSARANGVCCEELQRAGTATGPGGAEQQIERVGVRLGAGVHVRCHATSQQPRSPGARCAPGLFRSGSLRDKTALLRHGSAPGWVYGIHCLLGGGRRLRTVCTGQDGTAQHSTAQHSTGSVVMRSGVWSLESGVWTWIHTWTSYRLVGIDWQTPMAANGPQRLRLTHDADGLHATLAHLSLDTTPYCTVTTVTCTYMHPCPAHCSLGPSLSGRSQAVTAMYREATGSCPVSMATLVLYRMYGGQDPSPYIVTCFPHRHLSTLQWALRGHPCPRATPLAPCPQSGRVLGRAHCTMRLVVLSASPDSSALRLQLYTDYSAVQDCNPPATSVWPCRCSSSTRPRPSAAARLHLVLHCYCVHSTTCAMTRPGTTRMACIFELTASRILGGIPTNLSGTQQFSSSLAGDAAAESNKATMAGRVPTRQQRIEIGST
ncbi:hypothetical protein T440DRAFT_527968 [Plenodomus tracheiphilus IPT5]|uniref:Uncharacterized protein n=1 Tax=Plenodomus tracheiphilus IPT5 TaxID=1408161 RepID=A0A6A7B8E8_9PLEO|nr:hypothetical protein T440DRAFT_527968 [Plenodomus tracheiphilus IPT5]